MTRRRAGVATPSPTDCPASVDRGGVDEWGPALAYVYDANKGQPKLVLTWYDTRGDPNNVNVNIWGATTNCIANSSCDNPFNNMFVVSSATLQPPGQVVPWVYDLADWWDYQAIGVDNIHYGFLDAWGGDARLGAANADIWSAYMQ